MRAGGTLVYCSYESTEQEAPMKPGELLPVRTFTRSGPASYLDESGLLSVSVAFVPDLEYVLVRRQGCCSSMCEIRATSG